MPWARALRGGVARARQFSGYSEYARGGHAGHVSRKLGDIVKIPLLLREEPSVVEQIWKTYHDERHDAVGLTLPARNATMLVDRAQAAPMFIFPVHRDGGYFSLVSQLQSRRHFIFTYLEDFKRNPNGARPHLTLTLHDDLAKEKDLVLLRGDIENRLTKPEAEHVINQMLESPPPASRDPPGPTEAYLISSRFATPRVGALAFNQQPTTFDYDEYFRTFPRRGP